MGPKSTSTRPHTVVVRFNRFEDRQSALRNSAKLKTANIYINEDLCESSVITRKVQPPELRKARAEGKIAYFSHIKLVIRDRGERTIQAQGLTLGTASADGGDAVGVSCWTSSAASVLTVTPASTLAGCAAQVGAVTGASALASGVMSAAADRGTRNPGAAVVSQ